MHSSGGTEEKMKVNDLSAKDYSSTRWSTADYKYFLILIALHHVAGMNTLEYVLDNGNLIRLK